MSAEPYIPERASLTSMRRAVQDCKGCPLYKNATQAVFGEGPRRARIVLVGEAPGNDEDLAGEPFVGPSGRLLDEMLEQAGIKRDDVYVTNAVKHFKFTKVGKRRLHAKPSGPEIKACEPWLSRELSVLQPHVLICLGATAARAVFGRVVGVGALRGRAHETAHSANTFVTLHPSALLRAPSGRDELIAGVIDDFILARKRLPNV